MHALIDLFLHLDAHLAELTTSYGPWVYAILFAIIFAETGLVVTPFLPGDSLLFACGALAARDILNPWLTFTLLLVAAIIGDSVNYSVGRFVGPRVFSAADHSGIWHRLLNREHLDRTHAFFEKYGGMAVVLGRFVPIVRTFVPFVAGAGEMTYGKFAFYNVVGAVSLGRRLLRRRTALRQRPGGEEQLLAGGDRHRPRLGAADRDRAAQETTPSRQCWPTAPDCSAVLTPGTRRKLAARASISPGRSAGVANSGAPAACGSSSNPTKNRPSAMNAA